MSRSRQGWQPIGRLVDKLLAEMPAARVTLTREGRTVVQAGDLEEDLSGKALGAFYESGPDVQLTPDGRVSYKRKRHQSP